MLTTGKKSNEILLFPAIVRVVDCKRDDGIVLVGTRQRVVATHNLIQ